MKTRGVEIRQFVANSHQHGNLRRRKLAGLLNKLLAVIQQLRLGIAGRGQRALIIKRFAGEIRISIFSPCREFSATLAKTPQS